MAELKTGRVVTNQAVVLRTPSAEICRVLLSVNLLHDADGADVGTVGMLKELAPTDPQTARYRSLLDGFGLGTVLLDIDGKITFANRKALHLLHRTAEEVQGLPLGSYVDSRQKAQLENASANIVKANSAATVTMELHIIQPVGSPQIVRADLSAHRLGDKIVGTQLALYSSKELTALIHSGRLMALGELLASVAHEVNNPLNNIVLASRNLAEDLASKSLLDQVDIEEIEKIERGSTRIAELIGRLRDFAKADDFRPALQQVDHLVREALALFTVQIRHQNIEIRNTVPAILPPVLVDSTRIQQVFVNLITNAIEAMEETEARLISIAAKQESDQISITFFDSGPGIPATIRENLFDPFVTSKLADRGTGAISRSILELHQGTIELLEVPQGGACFEICFPIHVDEVEYQ
jgi:PAS domain S-box-containing protein